MSDFWKGAAVFYHGGQGGLPLLATVVKKPSKKSLTVEIAFGTKEAARVPVAALEHVPQETIGSRFPPDLEAQRLEARQIEVQRQQRKVIASRLDVGAKVRYSPKPGHGDVLHAGLPCEVVRPGKPGAANPTVRVKFADGHELTVLPGLLERLTTAFKARPAPTPLHPVVEALRDRASYKVLLHLAAAELNPEADESTRVETRAQALKMMRGHLKAYPQLGADLMVLTTELLDVAWREAALRFDKRARQQRVAGPNPERPAHLLNVTPRHINQLQRQESNLIAAAILDGDVIHDARPEPTHPTPPSQPKRQGEIGDFEDTYREMHNQAMLCVRYALSGSPSLIYHHAQRADDARLRYEALGANLAAHRTNHWSGRYHDGDRYEVDLPDGEDPDTGDVTDWQTHYFELAIVWAEDGCSLDVANGIEIEAASGIWVGDEGWASLCRWLEHHDDRLNRGAQRGRQVTSHEDLIWRYREGDGTYRLREQISERYPSLERALEAVRCLARVESHLESWETT